jgi:hypothetical protein
MDTDKPPEGALGIRFVVEWPVQAGGYPSISDALRILEDGTQTLKAELERRLSTWLPNNATLEDLRYQADPSGRGIELSIRIRTPEQTGQQLAGDRLRSLGAAVFSDIGLGIKTFFLIRVPNARQGADAYTLRYGLAQDSAEHEVESPKRGDEHNVERSSVRARADFEVAWIDASGETRSPSSREFACLLLNLQAIAELTSPAVGDPPHFLDVEVVRHPNMTISLKGLAETVKAVADIVRAVPDLVVSLVTIRGKVRVARAKQATEQERAIADKKKHELAEMTITGEALQKEMRIIVDRERLKVLNALVADLEKVVDSESRIERFREIERFLESPTKSRASIRARLTVKAVEYPSNTRAQNTPSRTRTQSLA